MERIRLEGNAALMDTASNKTEERADFIEPASSA